MPALSSMGRIQLFLLCPRPRISQDLTPPPIFLHIKKKVKLRAPRQTYFFFFLDLQSLHTITRGGGKTAQLGEYLPCGHEDLSSIHRAQ